MYRKAFFSIILVFVLLSATAQQSGETLQTEFPAMGIHQLHEQQFGKPDQEMVEEELVETKPVELPPAAMAVTPDVNRVVFSYHPYWSDGKEETYRYNWLTHVAYFSVGINKDTGALDTTPSGPTYWATRAASLITYAQNNGVKVVLCATLFGTSNVTDFLNNSSAQATAITNLLNEVKNNGVDGVSIDFEYVGSGMGDEFTTFMTNLANAFHTENPNYHVSFAGPAGSWAIGNLQLSQLCAVCDHIFIMCYAYHYSGSSVAGPVAPLYPSSFWGSSGISSTVNYYVSHGATASKLIVGLPNYGIDWPCDGPDRGASTTGSGSSTFYYNNHYDVETGAQVRLYDSDSDSAWWSYGSYRQNWYDDHVSLQEKINYAATAHSGQLGGTGFWALGYDVPNSSYDDCYPLIWQAVAEELSNPPYVMENFEVWDNNWRDPNYSGNTSGDTDGNSTFVQSGAQAYGGSNYSGRLYYDFEQANGFIREVYYPHSGDSAVRQLAGRGFFEPDATISVWLYGDASDNKFYFCLRDDDNELERSDPVTIDWSGWQQLTWDLGSDPVNGWITGDGIIDGVGKTVKLDSFHLLADTGTWTGTLYFDDLSYIPGGMVTPTPTPSPSPSPTAGPTPSPSPSPTPACEEVYSADFESYQNQGWQFGTVTPQSYHLDWWADGTQQRDSGSLGLQGPNETTNYFALWHNDPGGGSSAIPWQTNSAWHATFSISTSESDPNRMPSTRMRIYGKNQKYHSYVQIYPGEWLTIAQHGSGSTDLSVFIHPPSGMSDTGLNMAFDLIDFTDDPRTGDQTGTIWLDEVSVRRCDLSYLNSGWTTQESWSSSQLTSEWSFSGGGGYSEPSHSSGSSGLSMTSGVSNTRHFGAWTVNDGQRPLLVASQLYRVKFNVAADSSLAPDIRLRTHSFKQSATTGWRYASYVEIVPGSGTGEAMPPSTGSDYNVYFYPPTSYGSDTLMVLAFDLIDIEAAPLWGGTDTLGSVTIEHRSPF